MHYIPQEFIHCLQCIQLQLREGWDRVQLGLPIRTLSQPYTNPIPTLTEPPLNLKQMKSESGTNSGSMLTIFF